VLWDSVASVRRLSWTNSLRDPLYIRTGIVICARCGPFARTFPGRLCCSNRHERRIPVPIPAAIGTGRRLRFKPRCELPGLRQAGSGARRQRLLDTCESGRPCAHEERIRSSPAVACGTTSTRIRHVPRRRSPHLRQSRMRSSDRGRAESGGGQSCINGAHIAANASIE